MEQFHPLDRLINNNSFSMLEALVPFVDYPYKKMLVLFIKYKEIVAIINCFNDRDLIAKRGFDCHPKSTEDFLADLCKLLPSQYSSNLQNIKQMMQVMQMMDMTDAKNDFSSEAFSTQQENHQQHQDTSNLYNSVINILNENKN